MQQHPISFDIAVSTLLTEFPAKTLKEYARENGIKLGSNKANLVQNIISASDKFSITCDTAIEGEIAVGIRLRTRRDNSG